MDEGTNAAGDMKRLRHKRLMQLGVAFLILVALFFWSKVLFHAKPALNTGSQAPLVTVATVDTGDVQNLLDVTGQVSAMDEVALVPQITAYITGVNVDLGDHVHQGQTLISLDNASLVAALHSAQASLDAAEATAKSTSAATSNDKNILDRDEQLNEAGDISKQVLDQAQLTYDQDTSGAAEAQIEEAQAGVETAEVNLSESTIVSPIEGVVVSRSAEPGETATAGAGSLLTVCQVDPVQATVNVAEGVVNELQVGQQVPIKVAAANSTLFQGTIASIAPAADSTSKLYPVKITIANHQDLLKPGMFAEIQMVVEVHHGAIRVPLGTVADSNGQSIVYVAANGMVKEIVVEEGISDSKYTEILSGLQPGQQVVISGQDLLSDGMAVKTTKGTNS